MNKIIIYLILAIWGLSGIFAMAFAIIDNIRTSEWWNGDNSDWQ